MPGLADQPLPLQHCTVLSLRPRGQHAGLRAACRRHGARLLALSPIVIATLDSPPVRKQLATALAADIVLFTSPNAVRAAAALAPLRAGRDQHWLAVGAGTQRALQRLGIAAIAPMRMDSEGLLALPPLAQPQGKSIGLITAPGGRGVLLPALTARGAQVVRADVYARLPAGIPARRWLQLAALLQAHHPTVLALSSGEALQAWLAQVPATLLPGVFDSAVVAASERLAQAARSAGFQRVATAASARPAALLQAATTMCG
ncbi:MAG: uroporphyrinogen-III synthase [Xanthomonadaceae bacterium]|nr:uroporphyrinogen-III synthase [Xanthomonadaceae bacterium]